MSYESELVRRAARTLRAALERSEGTTFEIRFRDFIAHQLSTHRYRVASGIVLGDLQQTAANDCLIFDAELAPSIPIDDDGGHLVVADWVYGAIQIIDRLDAISLAQAADAIAALKRVRRPRLVNQGESRISYLGAVVAESGIVGEELLDAIAAVNRDREFIHQIDIICVLDRGLVSFVEVDPDGSITLELPVEASARWRLSWMPLEEETLFGFYLAMWQSLVSRDARSSSIHQLLRILPSHPGKTLEAPHGVDRGE